MQKTLTKIQWKHALTTYSIVFCFVYLSYYLYFKCMNYLL